MPDYDDEYPTCDRTFATLRFYHDTEPPESVTKTLGLSPTKTQTAGDQRPRSKSVIKQSGWFLRSEDHVDSRDTRRHIDWILELLEPKSSEVQNLQADGWEGDFFCFWLGHGHGGPTLDPYQLQRLAILNLSCGFDVYHDDEGEQDEDPKPDNAPS